MKEIDKDTAFIFANELADAAAKITLPLFRQSLDVSSKIQDGFDPVTKADKDTEQKLRDLINAQYPDHAILGEEFGFKAGTQVLIFHFFRLLSHVNCAIFDTLSWCEVFGSWL